MSFYVKRWNPSTCRGGWTGPFRSERQADKEVVAWQSVEVAAVKFTSTPAVRAEVRAWQREADLKRETS